MLDTDNEQVKDKYMLKIKLLISISRQQCNY
jgi:hypothetical protein